MLYLTSEKKISEVQIAKRIYPPLNISKTYAIPCNRNTRTQRSFYFIFGNVKALSHRESQMIMAGEMVQS